MASYPTSTSVVRPLTSSLTSPPNGVIEYRSNAENGNLRGALLVCRYSGGSDIMALLPDGANGDVSTVKVGIPGFTGFTDPLDLTEDVTTGNLYVSDFGTRSITLLRPGNQATRAPLPDGRQDPYSYRRDRRKLRRSDHDLPDQLR